MNNAQTDPPPPGLGCAGFVAAGVLTLLIVLAVVRRHR